MATQTPITINAELIHNYGTRYAKRPYFQELPQGATAALDRTHKAYRYETNSGPTAGELAASLAAQYPQWFELSN